MRKVGLLSDTHGFLDPDILKFIENTDEIWHAGDIGSVEVAETLQRLKPLKAVYGNIDGTEIRLMFPRVQYFTIEKIKVCILHIGGYPGHYERNVKEMLKDAHVAIFIAGHSHILKVIHDKELDLLHLNPGAAGKSGFHTIQTAMRFEIDGADIKNMEIYEKPRH